MPTTDTIVPPLVDEKHKSTSDNRNKAYIFVTIALAVGSFGPSIARFLLNDGMPPIAIIGIRVPLAFLILTPIVWRNYRDEILAVSRGDVLLTAFAGFWMYVSFVMLFASWDYIALFLGFILYSTSPLWVAGMETIFLKERLPTMVIIGVICALIGSTLIGLSSTNQSTSDDSNIEQDSAVIENDSAKDSDDALLGIVLALTGAVANAAYFTSGRKARQSISFIPYMWGLCASGGIVGLLVVVLTKTPVTGYSPVSYFWLLVLVILLQLTVHMSLNYAIGYISATVVSISGQFSTVLIAIIAFVLFAEIPTIIEVVGSVVILLGVVAAVWGQRNVNGKQAENTN
jgi:drug/metabolite transporter (DMT)-like permease